MKFIRGLINKPTQWFLGMLLAFREKFFVASKVNGVDDNNALESKPSEEVVITEEESAAEPIVEEKEAIVSEDQLYYEAIIEKLENDISNPMNGSVNRQILTGIQGGIHHSSEISSEKKSQMFSSIARINAFFLVNSEEVLVASTTESTMPIIEEVETPSPMTSPVISPKPASPEKNTSDKKEKYAKNLEKISGFLKILSDKADELNTRNEKAAYAVMRLILDDFNAYGNEYLIDGKATEYKNKVELLMKEAENNPILTTHRDSLGLKSILNTLASIITTILTFGIYKGTLFSTDSRNQVIAANKRFANDLAVTPFDSDEQEEPTDTFVASM